MSSSKEVAKPQKTSAYKQLWSMHWIMAACYLAIFIGGSFMARLPRELFIRNPLYDFHKSMGVLTMALLTWRIFYLLRVYWTKYTRRQPKMTGDWIRTFTLHALLYLFMLVTPVTGFFFSNSFKSNNVRFFGITMPDIFPENAAMVEIGRSLHFWLAYAFLAFIILHTVEQWKFAQGFWRRVSKMNKLKEVDFKDSP